MKIISENTVQLITKEVLEKLNIKVITHQNLEDIWQYFSDLEVYYANGEEENYYGVDRKLLNDICYAVDELNNPQDDDIDVQDLNKRLGLIK